MAILILSHVPHSDAPYEKWLAHVEEELVLFAVEGVVDTYPADAYAHIEAYSPIMLNETVFLRVLELTKKYQFTSVVTLDEFALIFVAKLRERLGLSGQYFASAQMYRDKVLMKDIAKKHGLRVPNAYKRIEDAIDIYDFVEENGYPAVVKPVDGAGSVETHILTNKDDVYTLVEQGLTPGRFEIETFVEGTLYHIDAIVQNGEVVFSCVGRHLQGNCLGPNGGGICACYQIDPESTLSKRLNQYTKELVHAFDTPENTTIHCELFHTIDDEIVLCEVASRTGGAEIPHCINQSYGIDLYQALTLHHIGETLEFPPNFSFQPEELHGVVLVPSQPGRLLSVPDKPQVSWLKEYEMNAKPNQVFEGSMFSTDKIGYVVIAGETEELLHQRMLEICENWLSQFEWEKKLVSYVD